jgi:hypothetical protein
MKKVKKIFSSVLFGVFGFALSLCIAPIAAVAVVCYMTKVSFEIGYQDDPEKVAKEIEKNIEEKEKLTETAG